MLASLLYKGIEDNSLKNADGLPKISKIEITLISVNVIFIRGLHFDNLFYDLFSLLMQIDESDNTYCYIN